MSSNNRLHNVLTLILVVALFTLGGGCSGDPNTAAQKTCEPGETLLADGRCQPPGLPLDMLCRPGEMALENGACQPAGLPPDMGCPPGEYEKEGGGCEQAGVPPEKCGAGFSSDGERGCEPILPADPCPDGLMAIPGETICREVMPCGSGDYGYIPVEANTQYVNSAYVMNDSNGTKAKPWKTIQDGVNAAQSGAIVAVAAGTYTELVVISGKPVRLWGRCPAQVELQGLATKAEALQIYGPKASETAVQGISITGPRAGIVVFGASSVVLEHLRLHDLGDISIYGAFGQGTTEFVLQDSLVERGHRVGLGLEGEYATVTRSVIRGIETAPNWPRAQGISAYTLDSVRSKLVVRDSVVEGNQGNGIGVYAAEGFLEGVVVRGTLPGGDGAGVGIEATSDSNGNRTNLIARSVYVGAQATCGFVVGGSDVSLENVTVRDNGYHGLQMAEYLGQHPVVAVRASLLDGNTQIGAYVRGGDAVLEGTIIRDTLPGPGDYGGGLWVDNAPKNEKRGVAVVRGSVIERNRNDAILTQGGEVQVETSILRETKSASSGDFGRGVSVGEDPATSELGKLLVRRSLVEKNQQLGLFIAGGDATIEESTIRDNLNGPGIVEQLGLKPSARSKVLVRGTLFERNRMMGFIVIGADAQIESSVVRDTQLDDQGTFGHGIQAQADNDTFDLANLVIRTTLVENSYGIGVHALDTEVLIESSWIRGTMPNGKGMFGDGVLIGTYVLFALDDSARASGVIKTSHIEHNARAGLANFSANVQLISSELACHTFDLIGEAGSKNRPWSFDGSNDNKCGCPRSTGICGAKSAGLEAPPPAIF